jgi:ribonuclease Y
MSAVIMIAAAGVGFLLGYAGQRVATRRIRHETEERTRHLLHEAEREAENKKREAALEAQASWYQAKAGIEQEAASTKLELQRLEKKNSLP